MTCERKTPLQEYNEFYIGENLDYIFDYTDTLALVTPADTIASSSWVIVGTAVVGTTSFTAQKTWAWLTAPSAKIGEVLRLVNTAVTVGGRTHKRFILLKVQERQALIPDPDLVTLETP